MKTFASLILAAVAGAMLSAMPNATAGGSIPGERTCGQYCVSPEPVEPRPRVPRCAEDEPFLEGRGDFRDGVWDWYVCKHPESFARMAYEDGGLTGAFVREVCRHPRYWKRAGIVAAVEETCH